MASNDSQNQRKKSDQFRKILSDNAYLLSLFCFGSAGALQLMSESQYIFRRVAASYGGDLSLENTTVDNATSNSTDNLHEPGGCGMSKKSISAKISAEATQWVLWKSLCGGIPPILTIFILASYSDMVGRRFLFLLPQTAAVLSNILTCLVIGLELPLWLLCAGQVMEGASGGMSAMFIAVFAASSDHHNTELKDLVKKTKNALETKRAKPHNYLDSGIALVGVKKLQDSIISEDGVHLAVGVKEVNGTREDSDLAKSPGKDEDSTDVTLTEEEEIAQEANPNYDKNRGVRILAIECVSILIKGCVMLGNGYFIRNTGFFYPVLTAGVVFFLTLVFTFLFVHNPENQIFHKGRKNILEPMKIVYRSIKHDKRKLANAVLCNLAFMLIVFADGGVFRVVNTYQMSPPFCYSSVEIGWYTGQKYSIILLSVPFLMLLKRLPLQEATMAGIGIFINSLADICYFILDDWYYVFFVVPFLIIPGMLPYSLTRSITSKLAGPAAHGAMFSVTSILELAISLLGTVAGTNIYISTVNTMRSAIFLYFAGLYFTSAMVYFFEAFLDHLLRKNTPKTPDGSKTV